MQLLNYEAIISVNASKISYFNLCMWVWDESVFAVEDDLTLLLSEQDEIRLSRCDS